MTMAVMSLEVTRVTVTGFLSSESSFALPGCQAVLTAFDLYGW